MSNQDPVLPMTDRPLAASGVSAVETGAGTPARSLSILVVEQDASDFERIQACLHQGGFGPGDAASLVWARSLVDGVAAAHQAHPDVVFLATSLPDLSGLPAVQAMNAAVPRAPIILLAGLGDDDALAIAALAFGAQDYLVKGQFDAQALGRALRYALVRGRLESRLRLFEVALDSAANGIVITDTQAKIEWANVAFSQMTGYSVAESLGANPGELVNSGQHDQAFYRQMWETILSGQVWRGELINRRKDGSRYDEALAIAPVTGSDGAIRNFVAIKQDISEHKAAQRLIQKSGEQLELALAGSGLGLWDWHVPTGEFAFSERWCAMLGYRPDEVEPHIRSREQLVHPEDWPLVSARLDAHLKGATPAYESEHRLRHRDGHWVWVIDRGKVVVRDAAGHPLRAAGTQLDISGRKRLNLEGSDLLRRIESLIRDASQRPDGDRLETAGPPGRISARQRQVLELVATGCTSAQIAESLKISPATVVTHRRDLMGKLNLHSVADLTRYAIQHRLIAG